jgi:hypothetical protein
MIISRSALVELYDIAIIGSEVADKLVLYFSFQEEKVICSGIDLSKYLNNFSQFPPIIH